MSKNQPLNKQMAFTRRIDQRIKAGWSPNVMRLTRRRYKWLEHLYQWRRSFVEKTMEEILAELDELDAKEED